MFPFITETMQSNLDKAVGDILSAVETYEQSEQALTVLFGTPLGILLVSAEKAGSTPNEALGVMVNCAKQFKWIIEANISIINSPEYGKKDNF